MPLTSGPGAAYRLQLNGDFPFSRVTGLLDYLADLGIRTVYLSPVLQARKGSSHGYDVTDPGRLWEDLGRPEEFEALAREAAHRGIGLLVDLVPNHTFAGTENPWWADLLEFGRDSPYADHFDIDWSPAHGRFSGRVFLPLLDAPLEETVARGELRWSTGREGVRLHLHGQPLPVAPQSLVPLLEEVLGRSPPSPSTDRLRRALAEQAGGTGEGPRRLKRTLQEAMDGDLPFASRWEAVIARLNDPGGRRESLALLDRQVYLLGPWREAHRWVNYRRFFQVNDLVGMRVEDPKVFQDMHALPLEWAARGWVRGFRIDHIDGLRDPEGYLDRLAGEAARRAGADGGGRPYLVVEKILLGEEHLPETWKVDGTTGYDFLATIPHALVDPQGLARLQGVYERFVGESLVYLKIVHLEKRRALREFFPGRLERLLAQLRTLSRDVPELARLAPDALDRVLSETLASYPRYRTYLRSPPASPTDMEVVARAMSEAIRWNPDLPAGAFRALGGLLLVQRSQSGDDPLALGFALEVQQFTGGVMAKGTEDAALYRYHRLVALNEVGGDPAPAELGPEVFHHRQLRTLAHHPWTLTTTSTHDTKRSEDVRARLFILSEMPEEWEAVAQELHRRAEGCSVEGPWGRCPLPNQEYFLYQTLVGAWPNGPGLEGFPARLYAYLIKALREGGVSSNWGSPNRAYEEAFCTFARRLVEGAEGEDFRRSFLPFQRRIAYLGAWNSLSQVLLKITAPGVPDVYQGCELFDLSLVDPDNRRPVDFPGRRSALETLRPPGVPPPSLLRELKEGWRDGRIKLYLTQRSLLARAADPELFVEGRYLPAHPVVSPPGGALAFLRAREDRWAITVVPRFPSHWAAPDRSDFSLRAGLSGRLSLPRGVPGRLRNVLTGEEVAPEGPDRSLSLPDLFQHFPVALLVGGARET
jgi:(1->4)-alpha-D-glucan 1-alpha-D-glucosylmutase